MINATKAVLEAKDEAYPFLRYNYRQIKLRDMQGTERIQSLNMTLIKISMNSIFKISRQSKN
jgi:hypothetical protein